MSEFWKEYFTWEFERSPEGYFSWQHLLAAGVAFALALTLAVVLGIRQRRAPFAVKIRTVRSAALLIDGFELLKLTVLVVITRDFATLRSYLPLFLCSIPLIVLPVAGFGKGRLQQAALDFLLLFGLLGGLLGTFLAGNIYSIFPVLHFEPLVSLVTHNISSFSALFIGISGLATCEKKNRWIAIAILGFFMAAAELVNLVQTGTGFQSNYMFLSQSDGTPFLIVEGWFGARTPAYAVAVALLMWGYMLLFMAVFALLKKKGRCAPRA